MLNEGFFSTFLGRFLLFFGGMAGFMFMIYKIGEWIDGLLYFVYLLITIPILIVNTVSVLIVGSLKQIISIFGLVMGFLFIFILFKPELDDPDSDKKSSKDQVS